MSQSASPDWGPISQVRVGMRVVDAATQDIGRIELIHMGDPQSVTTAGNDDRPAGPLERVAEVLGGTREPDVPEPLRSRLVRSGYLKIDGPGLFQNDRYVSTEHVRSVAGDQVTLDVPRAALLGEA